MHSPAQGTPSNASGTYLLHGSTADPDEVIIWRVQNPLVWSGSGPDLTCRARLTVNPHDPPPCFIKQPAITINGQPYTGVILILRVTYNLLDKVTYYQAPGTNYGYLYAAHHVGKNWDQASDLRVALKLYRPEAKEVRCNETSLSKLDSDGAFVHHH